MKKVLMCISFVVFLISISSCELGIKMGLFDAIVVEAKYAGETIDISQESLSLDFGCFDSINQSKSLEFSITTESKFDVEVKNIRAASSTSYVGTVGSELETISLSNYLIEISKIDLSDVTLSNVNLLKKDQIMKIRVTLTPNSTEFKPEDLIFILDNANYSEMFVVKTQASLGASSVASELLEGELSLSLHEVKLLDLELALPSSSDFDLCYFEHLNYDKDSVQNEYSIVVGKKIGEEHVTYTAWIYDNNTSTSAGTKELDVVVTPFILKSGENRYFYSSQLNQYQFSCQVSVEKGESYLFGAEMLAAYSMSTTGNVVLSRKNNLGELKEISKQSITLSSPKTIRFTPEETGEYTLSISSGSSYILGRIWLNELNSSILSTPVFTTDAKILKSGDFHDLSLFMDPPESAAGFFFDSSDEAILSSLNNQYVTASQPGTVTLTAINAQNPTLRSSATVTIEAAELPINEWLTLDHPGLPVYFALDTVWGIVQRLSVKSNGIDGYDINFDNRVSYFDSSYELVKELAEQQYPTPYLFYPEEKNYFLILEQSISAYSGNINQCEIFFDQPKPIDDYSFSVSDITTKVGQYYSIPLTTNPANLYESIRYTCPNLDELFVSTTGVRLLPASSLGGRILTVSPYNLTGNKFLTISVEQSLFANNQNVELEMNDLTQTHLMDVEVDRDYKLYLSDADASAESHLGNVKVSLLTGSGSAYSGATGIVNSYSNPIVIRATHNQLKVLVSKDGSNGNYSMRLEKTPESTSLNLSLDSISLVSGVNQQLAFSALPVGTLGYLFYSDDSSIVEVSQNGEIFSKKPGTTTIHIESPIDSSISDTIEVTVSAQSIALNTPVIGILNYPSGIAEKWYEISVSNDSIYSVSVEEKDSATNKFTMDVGVAFAAGTDKSLLTTFKDDSYSTMFSLASALEDSLYIVIKGQATAEFGTFQVTAREEIAAQSIVFNPTSGSYESNNTYNLPIEIEPLDVNQSSIIYSSSNTTVVDFVGGELITKKPGTAIITAKSTHDHSITADYSVTVTAPILTQGEWMNGNKDANETLYYSIPVTNGTRYQISLADSDSGLGYTCNVSMYYYTVSGGRSRSFSSAYPSPIYVTANGTGSIIIQVYSQYSSYFGTFGVKYE